MNFPLVPEYKKDILRTNPENKVVREPFKLPAGAKKGYIVVPVHSPFFVESLVMYKANGEEMVCGENGDYRIYRIMGDLTALAANSVSCMIEILDTTILSGWMDYDIIGQFSLFDSAFMKMIVGVANDDRPVWWDDLRNKPKYFRPKLHGHSLLYEIVALKDMVSLVDDIFGLLTRDQRTPLEVKFEHYLDLVKSYIRAYKVELKLGLERHEGAYNAHGWNKATSGLDKVDNFPTARGAELLQPRRDRHLTPDGIETILNVYGFNSSELLEQNKIPVSQFGNTNFIPPSIDGSFEGLGGRFETAGITMESDGSLVMLWNRMDGREEGLYYSMIDTPNHNPQLNFSGFKYTHQRFEADDTNPNLIAVNSGPDVIMVADEYKQRYYIGLTNGTLDPSKHVYSEINLNALRSPGFPSNFNISGLIPYTSIALMGDWIYIFCAHNRINGGPPPANEGGDSSDKRYRYVYRVLASEVKAQRPVIAVPVLISYTDADGTKWTNTPLFRWCTPVADPNGTVNYPYSKYYFKLQGNQGRVTSVTGFYRSQPTITCPIPDKPGKYIVKFLSAYHCIMTIPGVAAYTLAPMVEMTYEFDPATNVFTLLSKTPNDLPIDMTNQDPRYYNEKLRALVFTDSAQTADVLADGSIVASAGEYQSFPRSVISISDPNRNSKYDTLSRNWFTDITRELPWKRLYEAIVSPLASSVRPKSMLLGNGGDCYTAAVPTKESLNLLYYRASVGKLAVRPNVTNKFFNNVVSRPLTNNVKAINVHPGVGGGYMTFPSNQLDANGTDLGHFTFCMQTERRWLDLNDFAGLIGNPDWPRGAEPNSIVCTVGHSFEVQPNDTINVKHDRIITYPGPIVDLLRREVENVSQMLQSPATAVQICDPNGDLSERVGWLPTLVMIHWALTGTTNRKATLLSIQPTYSGTGASRTVTGYTVLDKKHFTSATGANGLTPNSWDLTIAGVNNARAHGVQRCGFYVTPTSIVGFMDSGFSAAGPGDSLQPQARFTFNRSTKRWTDATTTMPFYGQGNGAQHPVVTPDNGLQTAIAYNTSTGGAGIMYSGGSGVNIPLLASVYPEVGWSVFAQSEIRVVFNGRLYILPPGTMDLRNIVSNPANKTFYVYAVLKGGVPIYEITEEKRLETPFQVWVGKIVTGPSQIMSIDRFNVATINSNRISEIKRGNSIPATSGLANEEGQLPWLRADELLP